MPILLRAFSESALEPSLGPGRCLHPELSKFYGDLMVSEAGHYTTFIGFARKYGGDIDVNQRWKEWLEFEAQVIQNYGKEETIHG